MRPHSLTALSGTAFRHRSAVTNTTLECYSPSFLSLRADCRSLTAVRRGCLAVVCAVAVPSPSEVPTGTLEWSATYAGSEPFATTSSSQNGPASRTSPTARRTACLDAPPARRNRRRSDPPRRREPRGSRSPLARSECKCGTWPPVIRTLIVFPVVSRPPVDGPYPCY